MSSNVICNSAHTSQQTFEPYFVFKYLRKMFSLKKKWLGTSGKQFDLFEGVFKLLVNLSWFCSCWTVCLEIVTFFFKTFHFKSTFFLVNFALWKFNCLRYFWSFMNLDRMPMRHIFSHVQFPTNPTFKQLYLHIVFSNEFCYSSVSFAPECIKKKKT